MPRHIMVECCGGVHRFDISPALLRDIASVAPEQDLYALWASAAVPSVSHDMLWKAISMSLQHAGNTEIDFDRIYSEMGGLWAAALLEDILYEAIRTPNQPKKLMTAAMLAEIAAMELETPETGATGSTSADSGSSP